MNHRDLNKIMKLLRWDAPKEVQNSLISEIADDMDFDHSVFLQPLKDDYADAGKMCWEGCARIFQTMGYPRCAKYIDGFFVWIQDMNWPGAEIMEELLLSIPHDVFMVAYERAIRDAVRSNYTMWLFILSMYVGMRKIKIDDFSDKKSYQAIEGYLDRANELLRLNNKLPT